MSGNTHASMSVLSSGHVSVGRAREGASAAFLLRVPASLLPGHVGGGDRRRRVSGDRQDPGPVLPSLRTQVSLSRLGHVNNLRSSLKSITHLLFSIPRHIFHLNPVTLMPEAEKLNLLEDVEIEAEEEEEEKKP